MWLTLLNAVIALIAKLGLGWLAQAKQANDLQRATADDAVQTAANETSEVVKDAADARSQIAVPADPGALAAELRDRAKRRAASGDGSEGQ